MRGLFLAWFGRSLTALGIIRPGPGLSLNGLEWTWTGLCRGSSVPGLDWAVAVLGLGRRGDCLAWARSGLGGLGSTEPELASA
jgi:hypothetical protein